MMMFFLFVV